MIAETVSPGTYRTRDGRTVRIVGTHPRYGSLRISDAWGPDNPAAYWWDNGVHPHHDGNDLVERIEAKP